MRCQYTLTAVPPRVRGPVASESVRMPLGLGVWGHPVFGNYICDFTTDCTEVNNSLVAGPGGKAAYCRRAKNAHAQIAVILYRTTKRAAASLHMRCIAVSTFPVTVIGARAPGCAALAALTSARMSSAMRRENCYRT